jgi:predicted ester cyclase
MNREQMTATAEKAIAAFNDPARRDEYFEILYEDGVTLHGYTPEPLASKPVIKEFYARIFEGFPDARVTVEHALVDGDYLTLGFRFAGTHDGSFMGVSPTGRPVDVPGITILRFSGSRCVERWSVADFLSLLIQVGAMPAPA